MQLLSVLSGIVFVVAFIPYIWSIVKPKSKARPAIMSWIIWAGLDVITLVGMYQQDTLNGTIIGATGGATIVAALAIIKGKFEYKLLDVMCFMGAMLGLGLWRYFDSPTIGIVITQLLIILASVPTWIGVVADPASEDRLAWTLYFIGAGLGVLAIPEYTLDDAAQPWTFFFVESITMFLLFMKPRLMSAT